MSRKSDLKLEIHLLLATLSEENEDQEDSWRTAEDMYELYEMSPEGSEDITLADIAETLHDLYRDGSVEMKMPWSNKNQCRIRHYRVKP